MSFVRHLAIALSALVAAISFTACVPSQPKPESDTGIIDLIPLHAVARVRAETDVIRIDSPQAETYFVRGWTREAAEAVNLQPPAVAAVNRVALLRFNLLRVQDCRLEFTPGLEGEYGKVPRQRITFSLNDEPIGELAVPTGTPAVQQVKLPAEKLHEGLNRLLFTFDSFERNSAFEKSSRRLRNREGYPGVSAYFSGLRVVPDAGGETSARPPVDEASLVRMAADGAALIQQADSDLQYAFGIVPGSALVFAGSVNGSPSLRVSARLDSKAEATEIWSFDSAREKGNRSFAAEITLDEYAGKPLLLQFSVRTDGTGSDAGVVWKTLRLQHPPTGAASTQSPAPPRTTTPARNVVFIILDAARPDYFGCYGGSGNLTPETDAFSAQAVRFSTAIAAAPYTIASMSTVYSGLLPDTHGVRDGRDVYPEQLANMATAFKDRGFHTLALVGNQFLTRKYGITRTFDDVPYLRGTGDKANEISTMDTAAISRGISAAAASGKPSFIYVHLLPPHFPYHPPAPFETRLIDSRVVDKKYLKKIRSFRGDESNPLVKELRLHYQNNLLYADHLVGVIMEDLKAAGLHDNSLIIIASDHGEAFAEHGALEHGNTVFEEMIRVPLLIKAPGLAPRVVNQPVGLVDIFPTLNELFELRSTVAFDGRSIAALIAGNEEPEPPFYYSRAYGERLKFTLRGERFKYVYIDQADFLYDLRNDPGEKENLVSQYPAMSAMLRQRGLLLVATNAARSGKGSKVQLSKDEEEELRNLGYLQ